VLAVGVCVVVPAASGRPIPRRQYEASAEPNVFVGSVQQSGEGDDNAHFQAPTSVDVDARGRVYVSDYMNDRVQVYRADGSHVRSLAVNKPTRVIVHPRTGEIYVFSWSVNYWRTSGNKQTVTMRADSQFRGANISMSR